MARKAKRKVRQEVPAKASGLFNSSLWTGISFGASAFLGFMLLTELRVGPIVAGVAGLAAYGFLAYVIPARVRPNTPGNLSSSGPSPPSNDPRVELLVEAHQHAATLSAAKSQLPLKIGEISHRLSADAHAIIDAVTAQPEKLAAVVRFFTYYLPSTADLVMDRVKLAPHAGRERLSEIDQTLVRLTEAFAGFKAAVLQPDLESVDLDISLLDDALDAELEDLKTR
jgi:5-bromo-4-chloroindolyl phosphate hydrolysis protein